MGIEYALRQQTYRNDCQKAMMNIILTHNWVMEKMKDLLDHFNLTNQQYNILRILRSAEEPLSTMQIRDRMLDKMSDTSRIVDRLVLKGLVQKSVSLHDKRLVDVVISEKGLSLLAEVDDHEHKMDGILSSLDENEIGLLSQLLDKLRSADAQQEVPFLRAVM
ncbi:MAG: MarR family transcriptional regulator [Bacteroidetes bacterium]|uniref:MarR family winged helix-turn-helix transcriptional regulator n=1 Tax=Phnomibacter sp. TaxID=2836217 RepID=UPI002FDDC3F4|nr:MarR family transcriptional regulator [Bacteroidota bacterium]